MCDSMNIFRRRGGPNPTKGKTMSYSDPLAPRTSLSEEDDGLGTQLANLDFEYAPRDEMQIELVKRDRIIHEQAEMIYDLRRELHRLRGGVRSVPHPDRGGGRLQCWPDQKASVSS